MAKFIKKTGKTNYYEIDGIRAGGIIPYFIRDNTVYLLINLEYRNSELVHNIIGGKVDKKDNKISDTLIREFNEETGFLMSDKIKEYNDIIKSDKNTYFLKKPKYLLSLINIKENLDWYLLPYTYNKIFENIEHFNDRDSEELKWINLFNFNEKSSYLLTLVLNMLKNSNLFRRYNSNQNDLFID